MLADIFTIFGAPSFLFGSSTAQNGVIGLYFSFETISLATAKFDIY
jgi:hypothetical protein